MLSKPVFVAYAAGAAFVVYFSMYAFRKPFAVKYSGFQFLGTAIELKTACVIAQIIGYTISKYLGTKICSEACTAQARGASHQPGFDSRICFSTLRYPAA